MVFPGQRQSSVHLWDTITASSVESRALPFTLKDPFFIDDKEAAVIIDAFRELAPRLSFELNEGEPAADARTTIYVPDLSPMPSFAPSDIRPDEDETSRLGYANPVKALQVTKACEAQLPGKGLTGRVLQARVAGVFFDATDVDDLDAIEDELAAEGFVGATYEVDAARHCLVFDAADLDYAGHVPETVCHARNKKTGYLGRFENTAQVTSERPTTAPAGP
ncbi:hypothetical protein [Salipiger mucosus]|uniref:Uncharacterized protein n=1 Tax=Salipiger mucosus DSM 16094 TaxID=1123237 RepID=S9SBH7_9RHOB|nr:hypothetical protein [Salipiger mucosus]EPX83569.1 hypothetical protein Salmuc_02177 [Salipiger mucosus DSM 16094]